MSDAPPPATPRRPDLGRAQVALFNLVFGYVRYAVVFVSAFVTLPAVLAHVPPADYGRWLVALEVVGYVGFAELGLGAVLPWLVAERVGRGDRDGLRVLLANVWACGWLTGLLYAAALALAWFALPDRLAPGDGGTGLSAAVLIVAVGLPLTLFGRLATGVLTGFQDVRFLAPVTLAGDVVAVGLTLGLVLSGAGLLGVAVGIVTPPLWTGLASCGRLLVRERDLVFGLPRPTLRGVGHLLRDGSGAWLGGVGGRLLFGSNALLLTFGGVDDAAVATFILTAKLGDMLNQQAWQVTDCGLVGLAQVRGAGDAERVRHLTRVMARLALVAGGGAALVVLALNPAFVTAWLGPDRFAGPAVNAALAASMVVLAITHTQATNAAVLGRRLEVGSMNVVQGVAYALIGAGFVTAFGPLGLPIAGVVAGLGVGTLLLGRLLAVQGGASLADAANDFALRWLPRAAVPLAVAGFVGASAAGRSLLVALPAAAVLGVTYLVFTRPLLADVPLPARLRQWAEAARLLPRPTAAMGEV